MLTDLTAAQRELALDLVGRLARERDQLASRIAEEATRNLPPRQAQAIAAPLLASAVGNLDAWLGLVGVPPQAAAEGTAIEAAAAGARVAASLGLSRGDLSSQYQAGSHVVLNRAHELVPNATKPADRTAVLSALSRPWIEHSATVLGAVDAVFEAEVARLSEMNLIAAAAREVLDGGVADGIGPYRLHAAHRAWVVLQSAAPESQASASPDAVWLSAGRGAWWGWGYGEPPAAVAHAAIIGVANGASHGVAGFRDAHRLAVAAARLAERLGVSRVDARHSIIELISVGDEETTRAACRAELGALAAAGAREGTLRATLGQYLAHAQNAVATAAVLGVTDRTVRTRIAACEELLGDPVRDRAAELAVALRVALLPASQGGAGANGDGPQ